ncbi:hypothetical protein HZC30_04525 [Candidatus Woesearchaeota archaeon]|nr:hypothetical protein [Candidatus Woesearchaeota archaeon]
MANNNDEYEIMPHQLLADLKGEVEALKKKLTQPDSKINELILEIESMKDSVHELNTIFQQAVQDTKTEDVTKNIVDINSKLSDVIAQNETIAKGMIAIADKVDDFVSKQGSSGSSVVSSMPSSASAVSSAPSMGPKLDFGAPSFGGPSRMAPPPMEAPAFPSFSGGGGFGSAPGGDFNFPPPPPSASSSKRKGLFR